MTVIIKRVTLEVGVQHKGPDVVRMMKNWLDVVKSGLPWGGIETLEVLGDLKTAPPSDEDSIQMSPCTHDDVGRKIDVVVSRRLRHLIDQCGKEQYLNALSGSNDLQTRLLELFSARLKHLPAPSEVPRPAGDTKAKDRTLAVTIGAADHWSDEDLVKHVKVSLRQSFGGAVTISVRGPIEPPRPSGTLAKAIVDMRTNYLYLSSPNTTVKGVVEALDRLIKLLPAPSKIVGLVKGNDGHYRCVKCEHIVHSHGEDGCVGAVGEDGCSCKATFSHVETLLPRPPFSVLYNLAAAIEDMRTAYRSLPTPNTTVSSVLEGLDLLVELLPEASGVVGTRELSPREFVDKLDESLAKLAGGDVKTDLPLSLDKATLIIMSMSQDWAHGRLSSKDFKGALSDVFNAFVQPTTEDD